MTISTDDALGTMAAFLVYFWPMVLAVLIIIAFVALDLLPWNTRRGTGTPMATASAAPQFSLVCLIHY